MHVFFVVATASVIVFTVLGAFIGVRVLAILKRIEEVSTLVSEEGEQLKEDIDDMRNTIHREGLKLGHLVGFFQGVAKPKKRARKS